MLKKLNLFYLITLATIFVPTQTIGVKPQVNYSQKIAENLAERSTIEEAIFQEAHDERFKPQEDPSTEAQAKAKLMRQSSEGMQNP